MKFLTDVIEKKRKIVEKIKNSDFHFSEEELFLIRIDTDLKKATFAKLSLGRESWTVGALSYFLTIVDIEDIEYIPEDTFYYACLEKIDSVDLMDLETLMSYTVRAEEIESYLREKLTDPSYQPSEIVIPSAVQTLLDCNRYDLLPNINSYYNNNLTVTSEMEDNILENYPFAYSTLPFSLDKIKLEKKRENLESLTVYELFSLFLQNESSVFPILREKIFTPNIDLSKPFPEQSSLDEFYNRLNSSDQEKFRKIMLYNTPNWYIEKATAEETKANMGILVSLIRERKITLPDTIAHKEILLQNPELLDVLVELGTFSLLFRSPLISEYVPKIIAKLDEKNPDYKGNHSPSSDLMQYFCHYPELFRAILRNNYYAYFQNDDKDINAEIEVMILEEACQNKSVFYLPIFDGINTLRQLLLAGNVACILENYSKFSQFFDSTNPIVLSEKECNKFIEGIKDNLFLQDKALEELRYFIFSNPTILDFYLHSNSFMLEKTISFINHHEQLASLYTDELYYEVREYYALKYHLSIDKLDTLERAFGPTIIRFLDNDTLQKITGLEDKAFGKLIALFPKTEFSYSLLETTYDSLKQYSFGKEHSDIISIFAHIKHSVQDNREDYKQDLENLISVMDDKFYKRFGKKYPEKVELCKANPKNFLESLIMQMRSTDPKVSEESLAILHTITDYFIATKREQYRNQYDMIGELHVPYEVDEKDFEKQIMFYLMNMNVGVAVDREKGLDESIIQVVILELIKGGMESSLAIDVVACYLKKDFAFTNDIKTVQKNVRFAIPIIRRIVMEHIQNSGEYYKEQFDKLDKLKRNYYVPKCDVDIYQILTAMRVDCLEKNLLEDTPQAETMYQSLLHMMEKYKIHVMPPCFKSLLETDSVQLSSDLTDIAGFISYYHQVYESEKRKLESQGKSTDNVILSLTNILINASVLSSASSVYNQFLGEEDARLVKANPGPNYATEKTFGDARLKEAVEWTLKNFQKMEVTIPTFSEIVSLGEKQMRVVVGNFTHPSNITHGERTGACMRIGGVGESLFNFCLDDKNGFHIRFEDEKTGEYISRVSGFRNGNTVFLNELRHSCNNKLYNDEEVIEACKKISSTMIEMSKDSSCPIENVVVSRAYATESLLEMNLGIVSNKKGLRAFYSDIQTSGVVLSSTGDPYTKVELDLPTVPTYSPAREKTYVGADNAKMMDMINRVHSIKQALSGVDYEYVEPVSFENEIIYGFVNQDWYICMDALGNIYEEIILVDKRALEELETARKLIAEYVPEKKEVDTYQY